MAFISPALLPRGSTQPWEPASTPLSAGDSPITPRSVLFHPRAVALAISIAVLAASPRTHASSSLHFQNCQTQTGRNASVLVKKRPPFYLVGANGQAESLRPGDELAAFTPEGLCVGVLVWEGEAAMLSLWEDDPLTPAKDGFVPGDPLELRVWDVSKGSVLASVHLRYHAPFDTTGLYSTNAMYVPSFALFIPQRVTGRPLAEGRSSADAAKSMEVALPDDFTLASNYPNPFRSSTTIRYGLPEEAAVRLDVYDALGRHVTTLVDEVQQPGWYDAKLHAHHLAAGLYIVRIRADGFVADRRMMLVR